MPVGTHQEMRRARFQTLIARGELIRKAAWFWTFGEGHRRPACVRRGAPWFEWAWFEYTSLRTAETAMPPSFAAPSPILKRHSYQSPIPRFYRAGPMRKSLASTSSHAVIALCNSARKASAWGEGSSGGVKTPAQRVASGQIFRSSPSIPAAPARDRYASVPLGFFTAFASVNLELMPMRMNLSEWDSIGEREVDMARKFHALVGLL